ncbi:hypothetical protein DR83_1833 [Francisella tularensis subsp. novicida]|nr:hypothetical protein DR83_1833 [Francisella tularensis subsp. novicida]
MSLNLEYFLEKSNLKILILCFISAFCADMNTPIPVKRLNLQLLKR